MEEIAKTITIYISHTLEIISALIIAVALVKLVANYFQSFLQPKNGLSAIESRMVFGTAVAVSLAGIGTVVIVLVVRRIKRR